MVDQLETTKAKPAQQKTRLAGRVFSEMNVPDAADWVGAMIPKHRGLVHRRYGVWYRCRKRHQKGRRAACARSFQGKIRATLDFGGNSGQSVDMTVQTPTQFQRKARIPEQVSFDRAELGIILGLYGRMVAAGEWRDYGISALREVAVFSVFRRTAEQPLYRIEKRPKLRQRQGLYSVIGLDGHILKRGHDLKTVLRVLERKLIRAVK